MPSAESDITATDRTISRLRDFLAQSDATNAALAAEVGVDEKVIRQARQPDWNPRAETLRRMERLIPADWQAETTQPQRNGSRAGASAPARKSTGRRTAPRGSKRAA